MTEPLAPPPTVTLTLPLDVRHASTVRVVAASLAADAGFSVDEIDDLRLGINEVVSVLADDAPSDPATRLAIEFAVGAGSVHATVTRTDGAGSPELDDLAQRILDAVTDHYKYSRGAFTLSKSTGPRSDGPRSDGSGTDGSKTDGSRTVVHDDAASTDAH